MKITVCIGSINHNSPHPSRRRANIHLSQSKDPLSAGNRALLSPCVMRIVMMLQCARSLIPTRESPPWSSPEQLPISVRCVTRQGCPSRCIHSKGLAVEDGTTYGTYGDNEQRPVQLTVLLKTPCQLVFILGVRGAFRPKTDDVQVSGRHINLSSVCTRAASKCSRLGRTSR